MGINLNNKDNAKAALVKAWGVKCWGCGLDFPQAYFLQVDHILPKADGGVDEFINYALLCGPCNGRKSNILTLSGLRLKNRKAKDGEAPRWYGDIPIDELINPKSIREWATRMVAAQDAENALDDDDDIYTDTALDADARKQALSAEAAILEAFASVTASNPIRGMDVAGFMYDNGYAPLTPKSYRATACVLGQQGKLGVIKDGRAHLYYGVDAQ